MDARRIAVLALGALAAYGCAPDPLVTTASLRLRALPSCPLGELNDLQLRFDGDFPSVEHALDGEPPYAFDGVPLATRWLSLEAEADGVTVAGNVARAQAEQGATALMLPLDASCPLGDPLAAGFEGAAVAALSDGALLIAGGQLDSGESTASAALLPAGEQLARAVEGGMLLRRAGASATAIEGGALIAGGAADALDSAQDTFELFELASQRFAPPRKLAGDGRRDHGAALLPDGRVLLAGGARKQGDGAPLDSAELLDPATGNAQLTAGPLLHARTHPSVLVLDDGKVLVALGRAADGSAVTAVERFDLQERLFAEVEGVELPAHEADAVAALEGGRVGYVGCDRGAVCELGVLLPAGDGYTYVPRAIDALADLAQLRLTALRDGQLLLTASARASAAPRAYLLDLAAEHVQELGASRVANAVIALADGSLAELDPFGASLRRHDLTSVLHDAPDPVIGDGAAAVALDLGERWQLRSGLQALADARFDLPALRFAALRIELAIEGDAVLLLEPAGAPPLRVQLQGDALRVQGEGCRLARAADDPLAIERDGPSLRLRAGSSEMQCELPALGNGRIGVALEAREGTRVQRLRVLRR